MREVRLDVADRRRGSAGTRYGIAQQLVGHQRDVGGFERGVAAGGAHRDPDIGRRERRRVVHAVPDHRDRPVAPGAAPRPPRPCPPAAAPRWNSSTPSSAAIAFAVPSTVAGQHDDALARPGRAADRRCAFADSRGRSATASDPDRAARRARRAPACVRRRPSPRAAAAISGEQESPLLEQPAVAEQHAVPVDPPFGAAARQRPSPRPRRRPTTARRVAYCRMACAIGCVERRSTDAARRDDRRGRRPVQGDHARRTSGAPRVSVPVLSNATQRTRAGPLEVQSRP